MSSSLCRQNFSEAAEAAINDQINLEFTASYAYQSMAAYFARDTIALPGFCKRYQHEAEEERGHAVKLIEYMAKRGGCVQLKNITAPEVEWKSALNVLEVSLQMEKDVNQSLLNLHKVAGEHGDAHLSDFLESEYLDDQVRSLKEIADLITQLKRVGGEGLGLYLLDQNLLSSSN